MKRASAISPLCLPLVAGFCLALGLLGCATQRVDWAARVGHYTYERAVKDLGTPEEQEKLAGGSTAAEWILKRGYTYTHTSPGAEGPFYPSYPPSYTAPSQYLRLTFGPDGQLASWNRVYK